MQKTAIITDSSAYLTKAEQKKYRVWVLADPVLFGEHTYHEGVDLDSASFFSKLKTSRIIPTTSQASRKQIQQALEQVKADGFQAVIIIGLSSGLSGFINSARQCVHLVSGMTVYVWDSHIACSGAGNQVRLAASLAQKNWTAPDILDRLKKLRQTTNSWFVVDNMRYLLKTGRISNAQSLLGSLLQIKPLLTFNQRGQIVAYGKVRTMKKAFFNILEHFSGLIKEVSYPLRITVVDGHNPKLKQAWIKTISTRFPTLKVESSLIGPYISVHTGPGAMGFIYAQDWQSLLLN